MSTLATVRHFRGRFAEAVELAETAVRLADRSQGRGAHRFHLHFYLGIFLLDVDRLEEAQRALQRGRRPQRGTRRQVEPAHLPVGLGPGPLRVR